MLDQHGRTEKKEATGSNTLIPTPESNTELAQSVPISDDPTTTASSGSSGTEEIQYRYLSFESNIPLTPVIPPIVQHDIPQCPNLRNYDDPFAWSKTRKNLMTYLSCAINVTASYSAGSYTSPAFQLTKKWGVSDVAYNVGITTFTAGFGFAPMVLAPFSEINGRRPVFISTGILFVVCQICCALTESYGGMLAARFFLGVGGSTFSTMVGGILADVWVTADRNTPMVLFTGATILGTGLGPLVSGFVAQNTSWRWVFWIQAITSGILVSMVTLLFKETRGTVILSRKAKLLNKWYEQLEAAGALGMEFESGDPEKPGKKSCRIRWRVQADEERASIGRMIAVSLYRPIHMLFTEPVVFFFSLWIAFSWGVLYLQFGAIPLVFETNHGFTLEQTGAVFSAVCVGGLISVVLSIYQEKWAFKHYPKISGSPEGRLTFACVESTFMPIGLLWFGFTCYSSIPWIVPTIAIAVATMGIFSIYLSVFNYTADVYHIYASSALAASGLCRNLLGGFFPLITKQMFQGLGFQAASGLVGGIGCVLTLVPWVLYFYGPKIRARSKIASTFT
ncbi:MFS transporter [Exophiala viscosa]|uniref:MFS transporter n=2 Tax=Exophiala viscosa TaxID=2486360 RepID=A0AAN6IFR4_9EURO|nr:MFS transporter [Exophiala viscosa]